MEILRSAPDRSPESRCSLDCVLEEQIEAQWGKHDEQEG